MRKNEAINKLRKTFTFSNIVLLAILVLLFLGFYYSFSGFRNRIILLELSLHNFIFSVKTSVARNALITCKKGSLSKDEFDRQIQELRLKFAQTEESRPHPLSLEYVHTIRSIGNQIKSLTEQGYKRVEDKNVAIYLTEYKFILVPYMRRLSYNNPLSNISGNAYFSKELSNECQCKKLASDGFCE